MVTLGAPQRRAILEKTHALEARIFRSVESLDAYAARIDAGQQSWVWTLEDRHGRLVGYNVILYDEYEYRSRPIGVYHANVGLLPEYRGHNRTVATGLRLALPQLLRNPRRSLYFHAYLLHPSIYVMMDKYADTMWPAFRTDPPSEEALELVTFLQSRQSASPPRWDETNPWLVRLPTSVDEDDEEIATWLESKRASARYFFEKNPHCREGGALVLLVPLTMGRARIRPGSRARRGRSREAAGARLTGRRHVLRARHRARAAVGRGGVRRPHQHEHAVLAPRARGASPRMPHGAEARGPRDLRDVRPPPPRPPHRPRGARCRFTPSDGWSRQHCSTSSGTASRGI